MRRERSRVHRHADGFAEADHPALTARPVAAAVVAAQAAVRAPAVDRAMVAVRPVASGAVASSRPASAHLAAAQAAAPVVVSVAEAALDAAAAAAVHPAAVRYARSAASLALRAAAAFGLPAPTEAQSATGQDRAVAVQARIQTDIQAEMVTAARRRTAQVAGKSSAASAPAAQRMAPPVEPAVLD